MTDIINQQQDTETSQKLLTDIQTLQSIEKDLVNYLETSSPDDNSQQTQIIEKINQITTMRSNLYTTLQELNNTYKNQVITTQGSLVEQQMAVNIVEKELFETKKRLKKFENEKNNNIRLIQINNYYSEKYAEHTQLIKLFFYVLIPILIITILYHKALLPLPPTLFYAIIIIISIIGGYYICRKFVSIWSRDNMDYSQYQFPMNVQNAPSNSVVSTDDPWLTTSNAGICIGSLCCSNGQIYDTSNNICVIDPSYNITTTTEAFVNNVFTKSLKQKADITLFPESILPANY
jgi:hypothetical protein